VSFSFTAVGKRAEVVEQLRNVPTYGNKIGQDLADLLVEHLGREEYPNHLDDDWEMAYVITAGGHSGGGSPLSLNVTVEPKWVPKAKIEPVVSEHPEPSAAPA
jgi:hypothetical protein